MKWAKGNFGESRTISVPEKGKETAVAHVRWLNCGSIGCLFLTPANLVLRNDKDEQCAIFIDHTGAESFGVVYLPDQTPEETARCAEAGLVEFGVERDRQWVFDRASNLTAATIFGACDKGGVVTQGTGCVVYRIDGERLICNVTAGLLRKGLRIRAAGVQEVRVNGRTSPARVEGEFVKMSGQ